MANITREDFFIPFITLLEEEQVDFLYQKSNIVSYKKRDKIIKQNTRTSHIMVVNAGLVQVYREEKNDKVIILKLLKEKNYLGLLSVFGDEIFQYSAAASDDVEVCFIDIYAFRDILQQNSVFAGKIMEYIAKEGLFYLKKLSSQTHKQLPGRIADLMLYLSQDIYRSNTFTVPFTRKELAEMVGTTKESLIRTLTEFNHDKIIQLDGNKIKIVSLDIIHTLSRLG